MVLTWLRPTIIYALDLDRSCSQPPSTNAEIREFTVVQDMHRPKTSYGLGLSITCGIAGDQVKRMHFVQDGSNFSDYASYEQRLTFGCVTSQKNNGVKGAVLTLSVIQYVFGDAALKFENCVYAKPVEPSPTPEPSARKQPTNRSPDNGLTTDLSSNKKGSEKKLIQQVLKESKGDIAVAAKKLGISEKALLRKMKEYNIATN